MFPSLSNKRQWSLFVSHIPIWWTRLPNPLVCATISKPCSFLHQAILHGLLLAHEIFESLIGSYPERQTLRVLISRRLEKASLWRFRVLITVTNKTVFYVLLIFSLCQRGKEELLMSISKMECALQYEAMRSIHIWSCFLRVSGVGWILMIIW